MELRECRPFVGKRMRPPRRSPLPHATGGFGGKGARRIVDRRISDRRIFARRISDGRIGEGKGVAGVSPLRRKEDAAAEAVSSATCCAHDEGGVSARAYPGTGTAYQPTGTGTAHHPTAYHPCSARQFPHQVLQECRSFVGRRMRLPRRSPLHMLRAERAR